MRNTKRRHAYTLAQLLLVLGLMSIMLALGFVSMSKARAFRSLDTAARETWSAVEFARKSAIGQNGATFAMTASSTGLVTYTVTNGAGKLVRKGTLPLAVRLSTAPSNLLPLTFASNGTFSTNGTITLTSDVRIGQISLTGASGAALLSIK